VSARRLEGKVAVITGAASGIGAHTASLLASEGACVVVADIDEESSASVVHEILATGGRAIAFGVDVGAPEQVEAMIENAVTTYGRIDILHNNAAVKSLHPRDLKVADISLDAWETGIRVNLTGPMLGCKYALPHMVRQGAGSIINTTSAVGLRAEDTRTVYGTTKAALLGLTRSVAVQYGKQGIRCNAIAPGLILKEGGHHLFDPEELALFESHHMVPRVGEANDIARAVLYLASDDAEFVTGQTIVVDGGFTCHLPVVPALRARGRTN